MITGDWQEALSGEFKKDYYKFVGGITICGMKSFIIRNCIHL